MKWLSGKKTYLVAASVILASITAWVAGDITLADAIMRCLEGLGLAALRNGVGK